MPCWDNFAFLLLEFTLFALCFRPGTKESVHGFLAEEVYAKKEDTLNK